ncbi:MAG: FmdE, Molybdenum formylmethanofuran dehydrogenase operon [Methanocella sp. PtaU1.Bin125]|nr:MAG: FmdE, Molybdenum formylmethanofuran dehydrogenase operon [Methanocella sp. PtaU1.Bin125]
MPFSQAVKFHGHICPGLAIGYYASHVAMRWLATEKSPDDEVYGVIETAGCGADAVQAITGCTTGKGNLIIRDNGKQVYTFGIRGRPEAIRIALRPEFIVDRLDPGLQEMREKAASKRATVEDVDELRRRIERVCRAILESPGESVFDVKVIEFKEPERPGSVSMVVCSKCGEPVSVTKARKAGNGYQCPACHNPE